MTTPDTNSIETRPALNITTDPNTPPHPAVDFFIDTGLADSDAMLSVLEVYPPAETPKDPAEALASQAIADLLDASNFGRRLDYDDPTWGVVMDDTEFSERARKMQNIKTADSEAANEAAAHTAVRGLFVYWGRLQQFNTQNEATAA